MRIADLSTRQLARRLHGGGVAVRFGPLVIHIHAPIAGLAESLHLLYHDYPLAEDEAIPDIRARLAYPAGARRFLKPKVYFYCDHQRPFRPMPPALAVPLLEWGLNWAIANRAHRWFMFHAACIEMNGHAAIMPGPPGSGKSTLTSALIWRGWRLLTDETTLIDPATGDITAAGRPVSLKNQSIEIIRAFVPQAVLSAASPDTHKGVLAHMRLPPDSLARLGETAAPRWVIFPRYVPGKPAVFTPMSRHRAMMRLIPNTFNYSILGRRGFETLATIVERCDAYDFEYSRLEDAIDAFAKLASETPASAPVAARAVEVTAHETRAVPPAVRGEVSNKIAADPAALLLEALREPRPVPSLSEREWDVLIRMARKSGVLARLACRWRAAAGWESIPARARLHMESAITLANKHAEVIRWEVNRIAHALAPLGVPVVLLKGGAYVAAGLPAAEGRLVNDVDIMVPREALADAEKALQNGGWESVEADPYDEAYYRQWMHELPPMCHRNRETFLDLHHNILPPTGRLKPDAAKLFTAARRLVIPDASARYYGSDCIHTLSPADMVLHSAAHLFQDGELEGGLRDLTDLDALLRYFSRTEPDFFGTLARRAQEMDLARPLYYVLRYTRRMLGTPVTDVETPALPAPSSPVRALMDRLVVRALTPTMPEYKPVSAVVAGQLLYIRAHWMRMPPGLLASHLLKKTWRRVVDPADENEDAL